MQGLDLGVLRYLRDGSEWMITAGQIHLITRGFPVQKILERWLLRQEESMRKSIGTSCPRPYLLAAVTSAMPWAEHRGRVGLASAGPAPGSSQHRAPPWLPSRVRQAALPAETARTDETPRGSVRRGRSARRVAPFPCASTRERLRICCPGSVLPHRASRARPSRSRAVRRECRQRGSGGRAIPLHGPS